MISGGGFEGLVFTELICCDERMRYFGGTVCQIRIKFSSRVEFYLGWIEAH